MGFEIGDFWNKTIGNEGIAGGVKKAFGLDNTNVNFDYDPAQVDYDPSERLTSGIDKLYGLSDTTSNLGQTLTNLGGETGDISNQAYQRSFDLMSGQSPILRAQRQQLSSGLGDMQANQNMMTNRTLASRGFGSGGLAGAFSAANVPRFGEQYSKGLLGISNLGLNAGMNMFGQASNLRGMQGNMYGQAGNIYGQAANMVGTGGNLASGIDTRTLQAGLANQGAMNQQQQFTMTSDYNQELANRQRRADFASNTIGAFAPTGGKA
tara:strand:- start:13 stop:807 length:795 start_codon:yes stop_codon:yes gene_type:complete